MWWIGKSWSSATFDRAVFLFLNLNGINGVSEEVGSRTSSSTSSNSGKHIGPSARKSRPYQSGPWVMRLINKKNRFHSRSTGVGIIAAKNSLSCHCSPCLDKRHNWKGRISRYLISPITPPVIYHGTPCSDGLLGVGKTERAGMRPSAGVSARTWLATPWELKRRLKNERSHLIKNLAVLRAVIHSGCGFVATDTGWPQNTYPA